MRHVARTTVQSGFGFTGEPLSGSDLSVYLRARHYNPKLGQFLSLDPLEGDAAQPLSFNRYMYVMGNVINAIDPSGLQTEPTVCENPPCNVGGVIPLTAPGTAVTPIKVRGNPTLFTQATAFIDLVTGTSGGSTGGKTQDGTGGKSRSTGSGLTNTPVDVVNNVQVSGNSVINYYGGQVYQGILKDDAHIVNFQPRYGVDTFPIPVSTEDQGFADFQTVFISTPGKVFFITPSLGWVPVQFEDGTTAYVTASFNYLNPGQQPDSSYKLTTINVLPDNHRVQLSYPPGANLKGILSLLNARLTHPEAQAQPAPDNAAEQTQEQQKDNSEIHIALGIGTYLTAFRNWVETNAVGPNVKVLAWKGTPLRRFAGNIPGIPKEAMIGLVEINIAMNAAKKIHFNLEELPSHLHKVGNSWLNAMREFGREDNDDLLITWIELRMIATTGRCVKTSFYKPVGPAYEIDKDNEGAICAAGVILAKEIGKQ